jgi:uncharacterized protein
VIELLLAFYKRWLSPALHAVSGVSGACRYHPSCSEYAAAAFERHGFFVGLGLACWRLLRCNPFSRGGFDPVPGTYVPPGPEPNAPDAAGLVVSGTRKRCHLS